jgi:hypothetical protein
MKMGSFCKIYKLRIKKLFYFCELFKFDCFELNHAN